MEGLIPLLLVGGLFFLMMRFGCGAHVMDGGHASRHKENATDGPSHTDPVCGMKVTPEAGYGKMHNGKLIRFCSRGCLDKFEAEPERYLGKDDKEVKQ